MKTALNNLRYTVEIFPFESKYPAAASFFGSLPNLTSSDSVIIEKGITSISFSRSKTTLASTANISLFGPVSQDIFVGHWCSINIINEKGQVIPRFLGQISSFNTTYSINAEGSLNQISTIQIKEWSFVLETAIKLDSNSLSKAYADHISTKQGIANAALGFISKTSGLNNLMELSKQLYNPFSAVDLILSFIGGLNKNSVNYQNLNTKLPIIPDICTTCPSIPASLLNIVVSAENVDEKNPFSSGFLRVFSGVLDASDIPFTDGVFDNLDDFEYNSDSDFTKRPLSLNLSSIILSAGSASEMIRNVCDGNFNEFFVELLYEIDFEGDVKVQPALFNRDKPFHLRKYLVDTDIPVSYFDDIPRINLDNVYIYSIAVSHTFVESANFIQIPCNSERELPVAKQTALIYSTKRLEENMRRYSGKPLILQTIYSPTLQSGIDLNNYYKSLGNIAESLYSNLHKFISIVLHIKDYGILISCGTNLQFQINDNIFIGHIESFSCQSSISSEGSYQNIMTINLSHCVIQTDDGLDFIPPETIQNIFIKG